MSPKDLLSLIEKLPLPKWVYQTIIVIAIIATINHIVYPNFYFPQLIFTWLVITLWGIALAGCIKATFTKAYGSIVTSRDGKTKDVFPQRKKAFLGIGTLAIIAIAAFLIPPTRSYLLVGAGWQRPLAFEPAKEGQSMLIIAKFQDLSAGKAEGYDPEGYIYRLVTDKIGSNSSRFPVRRYNQSIISSSEQAKQLLKDYNSAVAIWGTYNAAGGRVIIEIDQINEWEKSSGVDFSYTQLDPQSIEVTLTKSVPSKTVFAALLAFGGACLQAREFAEAENIFHEALKFQVDNAEKANVLIYRGIAFDRQRKYDLAIADYDSALVIDPLSIWAYDSRGSTFSHVGKYDLAINDYNKVLEIKPRFAKAYNNRGIIYFLAGQYTLAIQDYGDC